MMYLAVNPSSTEITNALNTLQNLCLFHEVGGDMLELLQRFKLLHVHGATCVATCVYSFMYQKANSISPDYLRCCHLVLSKIEDVLLKKKTFSKIDSLEKGRQWNRANLKRGPSEPACTYSKVNNRNTRTRSEICSKLTIKAPLVSFWCLYC